MSDPLVRASMVSGAARGIKESMNYLQNAPERKVAREEAALRKQQMEVQLQKAQNDLAAQPDPLKKKESSEQQLDLLYEQSNRIFGELAKQRSFDAFRRFNADGDARHLNIMLQDLRKNPAGAALFPDAVRVDAITDRTPEVDMLLRQAGIQDLEGFWANPDVKRSFIKTTNADGSVEIESMYELYIGTGFANHMLGEELDMLLKRANIARALRTSKGSGGSTQEEREAQLLLDNGEAIDMADALMKVRERKANFGSVDERQSYRDGRGIADEVDARLREKRKPEAERKQEVVDMAMEDLDEVFDGDFLTADISELSSREQKLIDRNLRRIEQVGGLALSERDKTDFKDISQLLAISDPGSSLSKHETGILDKLFMDVKKYVSDDVKGVDATSAYAAFRNSVRNALFGSALTEAEIQSFNEAFGTLRQQAGPVLQQFRTALMQVRGKFEALKAVNNPYVVKARLGKSSEDLDNTINALNERIATLERLAPKGTASTAGQVIKQAKDAVDKVDRKPLSSYFGE